MVEISIERIFGFIWISLRAMWYWRNGTWPLRMKVINDVVASFLYPTRQCHVEVMIELHPRKSPIILKNIHLEIKGQDSRQVAINGWKEYEQLTITTKRTLLFVYDEFTDNQEGRVITRANDNVCRSRWLLIKLLNKKDDLPPLDTFEGKTRVISIPTTTAKIRKRKKRNEL